MKTRAARMLASLALLAGCEMSHGGESNTSGSNWLRCKRVSECGVAEAVSCSSDGYCTDEAGERIESQGSTLKPSEAGASDAGIAADGARSDAGPLEKEFDCVWGIEEALLHVDASAPDRANCGTFGVSYSAYGFLTMIGAEDCFERGQRESKRGVELSVNRCIDCNSPTTYVATPEGKFYAIWHDDNAFSGPLRSVKIESCSSVALNETQTDFECTAAKELYTCSESRSIARSAPMHPRIEPYKLTDPPSRAGVPNAMLHVYVSNQSFALPLINIGVELDEVSVLTGDFTVGTQHTWVQFDLEVPIGTHKLNALGLNYREQSGRGGASLSRDITVQAERWVVLNYWLESDEGDGMFTLSESDVPVGFD